MLSGWGVGASEASGHCSTEAEVEAEAEAGSGTTSCWFWLPNLAGDPVTPGLAPGWVALSTQAAPHEPCSFRG